MGGVFVYSSIVLSQKFLIPSFDQILMLPVLSKQSSELLKYCMSAEFWLGIAIGVVLVYWCFNSIRQLIGISWGFSLMNSKVKNSKKQYSNNYWIIDSNTDEAFTHGLIKPQVYISKHLVNTLKPKELNIILKHESMHQSQFDPLKNLIAQTIRAILPPLPFKNEIFRIYVVLTELTADQNALGKNGSKQTLLNLLHQISNNNNNLIIGFTSEYNRVNLLTGNTTLNIRLVSALITTVILISLGNIILLAKAEAPYLCRSNGSLTLDNLNQSVDKEAQVCTDSSSDECVLIETFSTTNSSPLQNQSLYFEFSK